MLTPKSACRKYSDSTLLFQVCKLSRDDTPNRTAGGLTQEATRSHSQCWLFVADTKSGFCSGSREKFLACLLLMQKMGGKRRVK